ncbi:FAD-binding domain-containing protein [Malaciobacter canalis]|uniref:FAD-binding domain-containing protein n=1 Tax=Malaciobacter canalis TaxID=1912871 RepID=UPI00384DBC26
MKIAIVIFRNNLRVKDNYALYNATKYNSVVLGLYSTQITKGENYNFKACQIYRQNFINETLLNLQEDLTNYGVNLSIVDDIQIALEKLSKQYEIKIYFDEEVGTYEKEFENILRKYKHKSFFNQTMIEPFYFDYTKSFSHFRKKAQKQKILAPLKNPRKVKSIEFETKQVEIVDLKIPNFAIKFKAGESEALKRVKHYMQYIHSYKKTRNEMLGFDNSTKFSAYLSVGAISARTIYHELKQEEQRSFESESSYWIYFELLWRDFFHLVMYYSKNALFLKKALQDKDYNFKTTKSLINNFINANTHIDIIDASIVELKSTGWLSNRNRQLLANYLIKTLGIDFRIVAAFFESYLIDYNPASNYGNIAYQAFVGNDKTYRVFDVIRQSKQYNGRVYINKWLNKEEQEPNFDYKKMADEVKEEVYYIKNNSQ